MSNAKRIWDFLQSMIGNAYGTAGLMGNLYAESGLNPCNLQNSYEKKLGMDNDTYTEAVDDGSYADFVKDSAGYGLAQWTYWSRKQNLLNFARERGTSIGDLEMQLEFLKQELGGYKSVMKTLTGASSVREASDAVLTKYERPANQSESVKMARARYGQNYYDQYATAPILEPDENEGELMGYDPNKVIQVALNEVGYLEKKDKNNLDDKTANAGSKNCTKYARDLDALGFYNGKKQGVAWCDVFVDWCFVQAYGLDAALKLTNQPLGKNNCGAGCKYSRQYYKKKRRLFDAPQPGDQIFFWPKDAIGGPAVQHTGLVYAVDGSYVYTIEGNTSGANGVVANGGGVCKKKYKLTYNRLAGFGRPDWGTVALDTPETVDPDALKKGDKGSDVTALQENLVALGYDLGKYGTKKNGVDGSFGAKTEAALKLFQKARQLEQTGVYDADTRAALSDAIAELAVGKPDTETPSGTAVVRITGNAVNIRVGDSTRYASVGQLSKGDVMEYVATAPNGWHAGRRKDRIVWVSNKYSTVETA